MADYTVTSVISYKALGSAFLDKFSYKANSASGILVFKSSLEANSSYVELDFGDITTAYGIMIKNTGGFTSAISFNGTDKAISLMSGMSMFLPLPSSIYVKCVYGVSTIVYTVFGVS